MVDRIDLQKSAEALQKIVNQMWYELGKAIGKQELDRDFAEYMAVKFSKKILEAMPALAIESDEIEEADSKYGHELNKIERRYDASDECEDCQMVTPRGQRPL